MLTDFPLMRFFIFLLFCVCELECVQWIVGYWSRRRILDASFKTRQMKDAKGKLLSKDSSNWDTYMPVLQWCKREGKQGSNDAALRGTLSVPLHMQTWGVFMVPQHKTSTLSGWSNSVQLDYAIPRFCHDSINCGSRNHTSHIWK